MRSLILVISLCLCAQAVLAQEEVRRLDWESLRRQGCVTHGVIVPSDSATPFESLRVASTGGQKMTIEVLVLEDPGVGTSMFALTGRLRHEEVEGTAYLELWAHFSKGRASSARTDAYEGPTRHLEGTSGWRGFLLPFQAPPSWGPPKKLVLNVVLPGSGTVWLGPPTLLGNAPGWRAAMAQHAWWIAAAVAAAIAVALEALLLNLARKGKARAAVTTGLIVGVVLGACLLGGGAIAAALRKLGPPSLQAMSVGLLMAGTAGWGLAWTRRRYDQSELRRMDAMDAV